RGDEILYALPAWKGTDSVYRSAGNSFTATQRFEKLCANQDMSWLSDEADTRVTVAATRSAGPGGVNTLDIEYAVIVQEHYYPGRFRKNPVGKWAYVADASGAPMVEAFYVSEGVWRYRYDPKPGDDAAARDPAKWPEMRGDPPVHIPLPRGRAIGQVGA